MFSGRLGVCRMLFVDELNFVVPPLVGFERYLSPYVLAAEDTKTTVCLPHNGILWLQIAGYAAGDFGLTYSCYGFSI